MSKNLYELGLKGSAELNVKPLKIKKQEPVIAQPVVDPVVIPQPEVARTYNNPTSVATDDFTTEVQKRMRVVKAPERVLYQIKLTKELDEALQQYVKDTNAKSRTAVIESVLRAFLKI